MNRLSLLYLFAGGPDVHVGHLLTVRVFDEVLGLSHSGVRTGCESAPSWPKSAVDARDLELSYP